ncbi:hypothetical protein D3C86_1766860 [compost metagenome]
MNIKIKRNDHPAHSGLKHFINTYPQTAYSRICSTLHNIQKKGKLASGLKVSITSMYYKFLCPQKIAVLVHNFTLLYVFIHIIH